MITWILSDPQIIAWLNKPGMEKLYNYPRYASVDLAAALLPTFNYFPNPPAGTAVNDAMTNIPANGQIAQEPEQFLITSIQLAAETNDDTLSYGVLADGLAIANSKRFFRQSYSLRMESSQGSEFYTDKAAHIPEGPNLSGFLSTGGIPSYGVGDIGNAMPVIYEVSMNTSIRATMNAVGLNAAGAVSTLTAALRTTLYLNGVRFRAKNK